MDIAVITYIDSALESDQTSRIAKPLECTAVGFVIFEDDDAVTLTAELIGEGDYRGQVSIPKVAIKERQNATVLEGAP